MRIPWVGMMSGLCAALGLAGLCWYSELNEEARSEADQMAASYAKQLYGKAVKELSKEEGNRVAHLTRQHFES